MPLFKKLKGAYRAWQDYLRHIPKNYRYTLGPSIDRKFFDLIDTVLLAALNKHNRTEEVKKASYLLDNLKFWLQIAWEFKILDHKKYGSIISPLVEAGNMLGNWLNQLKKQDPTSK